MTFSEQDELLKYEHNLASCYEAEYLLSMKLQEGMIYGSTSSAGSSSCYYDGFEVQKLNPSSGADTTQASGGTPISSCDNLIADNECMETDMNSNTSSHTNDHPPCTHLNWSLSNQCAPPTFHPHQGTCDSGASEMRPFNMNQTHSPEQPSLHNEGPSRKRVCLSHS